MAAFTGFDESRKDSDTLKYNAMKVLEGLDPNDPNAITQAYNTLNGQAPGQYELDSQGNLMLTGTVDGYIGARPVGWGNGGEWYEPGEGDYNWQWMAYNSAHQGPNGEGAEVGASPESQSEPNTESIAGKTYNSSSTPYSPGAEPAVKAWSQPDPYQVPDGPNISTSMTSNAAAGTVGLGNDGPAANDLYQYLMDIAKNTSLVVDPNDPIMKAQVDSYDATNQRARQRYLAEVAERAGPHANLVSETRSTAETGAQSTASFQAALAAQEVTARREEIQQALNGAYGLLSNSQKLQLEKELAQLQLMEQQYEFKAGLGQRNSEFQSALSRGAYEYDTNLAQQQYQYKTSLGQKAYEFDRNQDYLESPLAG